MFHHSLSSDRKCTSLRDYMVFVDKVRMKKESDNKDIKTAVTEAVDECIDEDILEEFFRQHRDEVIDVSIYEYDEEGHMKVVREEGFQQGRESALLSMIIKKVKKGKSVAEIASELEEEVADIQPLYDAVAAAAPEYDMEKIRQTLYGTF
jgi:hypothetical protein